MLSGHTRYISYLGLFNDMLVSGSYDGSIRLWDKKGICQFYFTVPYTRMPPKALPIICTQYWNNNVTVLFKFPSMQNTQPQPKGKNIHVFSLTDSIPTQLFENDENFHEFTALQVWGTRLAIGRSDGGIAILSNDKAFEERLYDESNLKDPITTLTLWNNSLVSISKNSKEVRIWTNKVLKIVEAIYTASKDTTSYLNLLPPEIIELTLKYIN